MQRRTLNERCDWTFWVPDNIADWDGLTHWERERFASMEANLASGMVLFDVGVEQGWQSAIYGSFVGHGSMVLVEPSPAFWPGIAHLWRRNGFPEPIAAMCAYVGQRASGGWPTVSPWPIESLGPDSDDKWAYRSLRHRNLDDPPTVTIDGITDHIECGPDAVTIDVEGAELLVLWGAHWTLVTARPLVWVSIHADLMQKDYGHRESDLHAYMNECGYDGHFIHHDHESHWLFTPKGGK